MKHLRKCCSILKNKENETCSLNSILSSVTGEITFYLLFILCHCNVGILGLNLHSLDWLVGFLRHFRQKSGEKLALGRDL